MSDSTTTRTGTTHDELSDGEAIEKLRTLIKDIRIAMVTSEGTGGEWYSRPMYAQEAEFDGDLWFATSQASSLAQQLQDRAKVLATFADTDRQVYVVVRGHAELTRDRAQIEALWNPGMKAWFPEGPSDPDILLVRVHAHRADYWEAPSAPVRWLHFLTAIATGKRPDGGERASLDLENGDDGAVSTR